MPKVKIKSNNATTTTGGDFYTREIERVTKKGTPEKKEYTPERAFTKDVRYAGNPPKGPAAQKENVGASENKNPGFAKQLKEAQEKKEDKFAYKATPGEKDYKPGLEYKAGTTKTTPATPDETAKVKQISITHPSHIQSSNGYKAKGDELESKGYKNIPGTYNYERPKKQVFVDEDKVEQYKKDNPGAHESGGVEHTMKERTKTETKKASEEEKKKKAVIKYKKNVISGNKYQ